MTIAITGGSGPFASLVREDLLSRGLDPKELVLITRSPERLERVSNLGVQVRPGDFDDPAQLAQSLHGVDQLLMISTSAVGRREQQHGNAIDAARAAGVGRIAYTSFIGKDPGNPSIAVIDHRITEDLLRKSGVEHVILRNSQYMDAITDAVGVHFIRSGVWRSAAGYGRIGLVRRADCAAAAAGLLAGAGETGITYDITGPQLLSFADMAEILGEVSGRHVAYEPISEEEMYAEFDARGLPREAVPDSLVDSVPWCSDDMISVDRALREGYMDVLSDDVELLSGNSPWSFARFAYDRADHLRAIARDAVQSTA